MTDHSAQPTSPGDDPHPAPSYTTPPYPTAGAPAYGQVIVDAPRRERVALGLLAALGAALLGIVLTVVIWRAGYVAAITSFALAAGAVFAYTTVAGAPPRKGLIPLVLLIVVGVAASFFACVANDASDLYSQALDAGAVPQVGRWEFVRRVVTDSEVLSTYKSDGVKFALFGALGIFGTISRALRRG